RHSAIDTLFENLRPAAEFLNIKQLSVPMNHAALMSRLHFNLRHFAWNYAAILFLLGMWSLNANRKLLTVTALVTISILGFDRENKRLYKRFTTHQACTGLLAAAAPIALKSKALPTLIWLVGTTTLVVLGHALLMDKP
ncbi:putative prenylated rab acceptor 1, partial [Xylogone sp. PMI_703]